jgi:hypothetical protein
VIRRPVRMNGEEAEPGGPGHQNHGE